MLFQKVQRNILQYQLVAPDSIIVVAVSGGTDSLALLHLLLTIYERKSDVKFHVASLDHGLRGEIGAADAEFVQKIAQSWGLSITVGRIDVHALANEHHLSIETAARQARYDFLASVVRQIGASTLAVAHHADDQAETILMHILRGAGLRGLRGMAFKSLVPRHPDLQLIRPLLNITHAELEAYCVKNILSPRYDPTNQQTEHFRNYIRLEVLPFLKTTHPQFNHALTRLGESAALDQDFIELQYEQIVLPHVQHSAGRILIARKAFQSFHPTLQRHCIQDLVEQISRQAETLSYERILAAVHIARTGQVGAVAQLPGHVRLRVDYELLVIEPVNAQPVIPNTLLLTHNHEIRLNYLGVTQIPHTNWQVRVDHASDEKPFKAALVIPPESIVMLRTRHPGDRFTPMTMEGHTRKIKEWMIDQKIPRAIRDLIPLLIINDEIAAICYGERWIVSVKFALTLNDRKVFYFFIDSMEFTEL